MSAPHNPQTAEQLEAERLANIMFQAMRQPPINSAPPAARTRAMTSAPAPAANQRQVPTGKVLRLHPQRIRPSPFSNRHSFNWSDATFEVLKQSIVASRGNLVPIKVRPTPLGASAAYEVVYGQRRHRACLALGLPVRAIVEHVTDLQLLDQMHASNEGETECTPYERGLLCIAAVREGLYKTARLYANAMRLDPSTVYKHMKLATLPEPVVLSFGSPKNLNVNWGAALHKALAEDVERVLNCAERIAADGRPTDAKQVFDALCGAEPLPHAAGLRREVLIRKERRPWATIDIPAPALGEGIRVQFKLGAVDAVALEEALRALAART